MATDQLDFDSVGSVTALITADPIHQRDRDAVTATIRAAVRPDGTVNANDFRDRLAPWIYPPVIGATVRGLIARNVLAWTGEYVPSEDRRGGNAGKPCKLYRWNEGAL